MKKNSEQSNDLARLKGARLVTTSEIEQGKQMSESFIKQITGGDEITALFLYGEYFNFSQPSKFFWQQTINQKSKALIMESGDELK